MGSYQDDKEAELKAEGEKQAKEAADMAVHAVAGAFAAVPGFGTIVAIGIEAGKFVVDHWDDVTASFGPTFHAETQCPQWYAQGISQDVANKASLNRCSAYPKDGYPDPNAPLDGAPVGYSTTSPALAFVQTHADSLPAVMSASDLTYYADYLFLKPSDLYGALQSIKGPQLPMYFDVNGRVVPPPPKKTTVMRSTTAQALLDTWAAQDAAPPPMTTAAKVAVATTSTAALGAGLWWLLRVMK